MNSKMKQPQWVALIFVASLIASPVASADAVCDWNTKVGDIVVSARMGPPPANRAMAIANTAVYEAVNAITKRYPAGTLKLQAAPGASVDAAIAAAHPHRVRQTASISAKLPLTSPTKQPFRK